MNKNDDWLRKFYDVIAIALSALGSWYIATSVTRSGITTGPSERLEYPVAIILEDRFTKGLYWMIASFILQILPNVLELSVFAIRSIWPLLVRWCSKFLTYTSSQFKKLLAPPPKL